MEPGPWAFSKLRPAQDADEAVRILLNPPVIAPGEEAACRGEEEKGSEEILVFFFFNGSIYNLCGGFCDS